MSKRNRPAPSSMSGNRFLNQNEFRTLFSKRPVLLERQMVLSDFPLIQPLFANLGWEPVTSLSASVPTKLVQEFYANFHDTDFEESVFTTSVNRTIIRVTPDIIASTLGIARPSLTERMTLFYPTQDGIFPSKEELSNVFNVLTGSPPWRGETYVHGHLKTEHRMLNLFVSATIDPTSHYSDVTLRRGRIIYAILLGLQFDLALFIFRLMFIAQQSKRTKDSLPFGVLITNIIQVHHIDLPSSGLMSQPTPITRLSVRKSVSQALDETLDNPNEAEPSRSTRPFTLNSMSLSLLRLEGEVENVRADQSLLNERMGRIEDSIHRLTDLCTTQFQSLHQQIDNWGAYPGAFTQDDDDDGGDDDGDGDGDGGDGSGFGGEPFGGASGSGGGGFDDNSGFF